MPTKLKALLPLISSLLTVVSAFAQVQETLPEGDAARFDRATIVRTQVLDSIRYPDISSAYPTTLKHPLNVSVTSDGGMNRIVNNQNIFAPAKHHIVWNGPNVSGSLKIALPQPTYNPLITDFIPRGIELYLDRPSQTLMAYVVGDWILESVAGYPVTSGVQPIVIPFRWQGNSFVQQELSFLVSNPSNIYTNPAGSGHLSALAQNYGGGFITVWRSMDGKINTRRFAFSPNNNGLIFVDSGATVVQQALGLAKADAISSIDVAMNESNAIRIAWENRESMFNRSINVLESTWIRPNQGVSQVCYQDNVYYLEPKVSIAMNTWNGDTKSNPIIDSDYAVAFSAEDPAVLFGPGRQVLVCGTVNGVLATPLRANPQPGEAMGEVTGVNIDGGRNFYEVAWNYLDTPRVIQNSGGTWEVLSQGISDSLQLISVGTNGTYGHKCISGDSFGEQHSSAVAISSAYVKWSPVVASYAYGDTQNTGAVGDITYPSLASTFCLMFKHKFGAQYSP